MSLHLHVFNLRSSATNENLRKLFRDMTVEKDGVTILGGPEGEAFVTFSNQTDLLRALKRSGEQYLKFQVATEVEKQEAINKMYTSKLRKMGEDTTAIHSGNSKSALPVVHTVSREDVLPRKRKDIDLRTEKRYDKLAYGPDGDVKYSYASHQRRAAIHDEHSNPDFYDLLNKVQDILKKNSSPPREYSPWREHSHIAEHSLQKESCPKKEDRHPDPYHQWENVEDVPKQHEFLTYEGDMNSWQRYSHGSVDPKDGKCSLDRQDIKHGSQKEQQYDIAYRDNRERSSEQNLFRERSASRDRLSYHTSNPVQTAVGAGLLGPRDAGYLSAHSSTQLDMTDRPMKRRYSDEYGPPNKESSIMRDRNIECRDDVSVSKDMYWKADMSIPLETEDGPEDLRYKPDLTPTNSQSTIGLQNIDALIVESDRRGVMDRKVNIVMRTDNAMDRHYDEQHNVRYRHTVGQDRNTEQGYSRTLSKDKDSIETIHQSSKRTSIDGRDIEYSTDDARHIINTRRGHNVTSMERKYDERHGARYSESGSCSSTDERNREKLDQKRTQVKLRQTPKSRTRHESYSQSKHSKAFLDLRDSNSDDSFDSDRYPTKRRRLADSMTRIQQDIKYPDKAAHKSRAKGRFRSKEQRGDGRESRKRSAHDTKKQEKQSKMDASEKYAGSSDIELGSIIDHLEWSKFKHNRKATSEARSDQWKSDGTNDDPKDKDKKGLHESRGVKCEQSWHDKQKPRKSVKVDTSLEEINEVPWFLAVYQMKQTTTATDVLFWCHEATTAFKINFFGESGPKFSEAMAFVLFDNKEASRNAEPALMERGFLTHRYELHAGYRFMAQLGDTCTITQTEYWGDRVVSLEDRGQPPFVVPEFVLTNTTDIVYLCVTGFYKQYQLTATNIWSWFHGAKGVALAITSKGKGHDAKVAVVAFGSLYELTEAVDKAKRAWRSHKNFTCKEGLSFLTACSGSYKIKISTTRGDRDLSYDEKKILSNLQEEQTTAISGCIPDIEGIMHPTIQDAITPKDVKTVRKPEITPSKSDAISDTTQITSEKNDASSGKSHTLSRRYHSVVDKPSDKAYRSSGKSHHRTVKWPTSKKPHSKSGKHHATSDHEDSTLDDLDTSHMRSVSSEKFHASSRKSHSRSRKSATVISKGESFIRHLKTPGAQVDTRSLVLTLFRQERNITACEMLSKFPTALCTLKVNFSTTGPQGSKAMVYILFENKHVLPSNKTLSKWNNVHKYLTRGQTVAFLVRLCGTAKISESTSDGTDKMLSMKDLKQTTIILPFTLMHDTPGTYYVKVKGVGPKKSASDIWCRFRGLNKLANGVILTVRKRDRVPCVAYIAYSPWILQQRALSSLQNFGYTTIALLDEASVFQRLRMASDEYIFMVSTKSGQDRQMDPDEEEFLRNYVDKTDPIKNLQNMQDFQQGYYIQLTNVIPKLTACEILSEYNNDGFQAKSVTLVRDRKGSSVAAFIRFEKEDERNSATPKYSHSVWCTDHERAVDISKLRKDHEIYESTKSGNDKLVHSWRQNVSKPEEPLKNPKENTITIQEGCIQIDKLHAISTAQQAKQQVSKSENTLKNPKENVETIQEVYIQTDILQATEIAQEAKQDVSKPEDLKKPEEDAETIQEVCIQIDKLQDAQTAQQASKPENHHPKDAKIIQEVCIQIDKLQDTQTAQEKIYVSKPENPLENSKEDAETIQEVCIQTDMLQDVQTAQQTKSEAFENPKEIYIQTDKLQVAQTSHQTKQQGPKEDAEAIQKVCIQTDELQNADTAQQAKQQVSKPEDPLKNPKKDGETIQEGCIQIAMLQDSQAAQAAQESRQDFSKLEDHKNLKEDSLTIQVCLKTDKLQDSQTAQQQAKQVSKPEKPLKNPKEDGDKIPAGCIQIDKLHDTQTAQESKQDFSKLEDALKNPKEDSQTAQDVCLQTDQLQDSQISEQAKHQVSKPDTPLKNPKEDGEKVLEGCIQIDKLQDTQTAQELKQDFSKLEDALKNPKEDFQTNIQEVCLQTDKFQDSQTSQQAKQVSKPETPLKNGKENGETIPEGYIEIDKLQDTQTAQESKQDFSKLEDALKNPKEDSQTIQDSRTAQQAKLSVSKPEESLMNPKEDAETIQELCIQTELQNAQTAQQAKQEDNEPEELMMAE